MNQDDPFGNYLDEDKTVLKPSPGRRSSNSSSSSSPQKQQNSSETQALQFNLGTDENVLLSCAFPILSIITQLRNSVSHEDVPGLRHAVMNEIKTFEINAKQSGCPTEQVQVARYALCTLLDEVVLNTPWGCHSIWSTQGMLISFHNESWGGEKFFKVLNNIIPQPGTYINLLELFYFCLSLGLEGKYKIQALGQNELYEIRENLYLVIKRHKGDYEQDLSLHWQGITDKRNALLQYLPLWVIATVMAALLMLVFVGFLYVINLSSNIEIRQQYQIKDALNVQPVVVSKIQPVKSSDMPVAPIILIIDEVRRFLETEIDQKKVVVIDKNGQSMIRILAKSFFASGSNKIQSKYVSLMEKISQALEIVNSQITVVGHTDNIPIFTVRYPSNWVLSEARAKAVANILLKNDLHKNKVIAEGRADTQSLVPNDSAKHRALNRRVEILFKE